MIENQARESQVTEKLLIESQPLNVNQLPKLSLKNHRRLERLEPLIQNQILQNVKHAFKLIY